MVRGVGNSKSSQPTPEGTHLVSCGHGLPNGELGRMVQLLIKEQHWYVGPSANAHHGMTPPRRRTATRSTGVGLPSGRLAAAGVQPVTRRSRSVRPGHRAPASRPVTRLCSRRFSAQEHPHLAADRAALLDHAPSVTEGLLDRLAGGGCRHLPRDNGVRNRREVGAYAGGLLASDRRSRERSGRVLRPEPRRAPRLSARRDGRPRGR